MACPFSRNPHRERPAAFARLMVVNASPALAAQSPYTSIAQANCAKLTSGRNARETIMAQRQMRVGALEKVDPVWARIRGEAEEIARREPELATFIYSTILHHDSL